MMEVCVTSTITIMDGDVAWEKVAEECVLKIILLCAKKNNVLIIQIIAVQSANQVVVRTVVTEYAKVIQHKRFSRAEFFKELFCNYIFIYNNRYFSTLHVSTTIDQNNNILNATKFKYPRTRSNRP